MVPTCVRCVRSVSVIFATPKSISFARALHVEHHVRRLDVAVDDAGLVRVVERAQQLAHHAHELPRLEAHVAVEEVLQILAADELHDDEGDLAFLAEVVHLHDVADG